MTKLQSPQEYHLKYLGHMESNPPTTHAGTQFIDSTLVKLKVAYSIQLRQTHTTGTDPMAFACPSPTLGRHTQSDVSVVSQETEKQRQPVPVRVPTNRRARRKKELTGDGKDVSIKVTRATPEPDLVLNESPKEIPKTESSPLLTGSFVPESQPPLGGRGEERDSGEQRGGELELAVQVGLPQEIESEETATARFSLGAQVLVTGNRSETGNQSETRSEPKDAPEPRQESEISHSRQSSQYETAEVTVEIADEPEEQVGEEDPAVLPPTSRKRSLTVLSEGGTVISEEKYEDRELPINETSTDGVDAHLQSPESVQDSESSRSAGSLSGRSSTSTSTHSLERVKSLERIKTNKSFVAGGCEEEGTDTEQADYDVLPDLDNLRSTPEFQALGQLSDLPHQKVRVVFSGFCVSVLLEESGELLLKRSIRTIACCAQVGRGELIEKWVVCINWEYL